MKDRKLLMIPGPIEFTPEVMRAMGMPTTSHVAPNFVEAFGQALERMREVFLCPSGQPFVVAGSGSLAMDMAAANLVEPGDRALVVNTGYFGDRFGAILERYGATVTYADAPAVGDAPALGDVEAVLKKGSYKVMTITHVDTSTAVCADVKGLAALGSEYGVLTIVDGVCSVAGEELRQEEWGTGRLLLRRLDVMAADHGGIRSPAAWLLWHAGGQPDLGAQREPGPDPRRGDGGALCTAPPVERGVQGSGHGIGDEASTGQR
jgi:alanine-glyoxylate transaminase/serine-glyoxylate transaminase/serine-pyruvate transaminase